MLEIWKDISKYEGLYQVSNLGRVKSLKRVVISKKGQVFEVEEKILKPVGRSRNRKYLVVHLCRNSDVKYASVHRLAAEAFIPNPNNLPFINHKDENPGNNIVDNLEWCTPAYNNVYGNANKKRSDTLINNKFNSKQVYQYNLNGEYIASYPSAEEAQRQTRTYHVVDVCNGKRAQCGGYVWKYA